MKYYRLRGIMCIEENLLSELEFDVMVAKKKNYISDSI